MRAPKIDGARAMNVGDCFVPTPKSNYNHVGTRGPEHAHAPADSRIGEIVDEICDPQRRPHTLQLRNGGQQTTTAFDADRGLPKEPAGLVGASPHEDGRNRRDDDPDIEPGAFRPDIEAVHRHAGAIIDIGASADLPQSRDAGLDGAVMAKAAAVAADFGFHDRTWTDDTHLSAKNIEKLRQLIEA